MSQLSREEIGRIARLSRLSFTDAELDRVGHDLNGILAYFDKLSELETSETPPTSHALKTENVFREDEVRASLPVEEALANAPDSVGDFFKVPPIIQAEE